MAHVLFNVEGRPVPQGSKQAFVHRGRVVMKESGGKRHSTWRHEVAQAARQAMEDMGFPGPSKLPVSLRLTFLLLRPQFHYGTGRNRDRVKPGMPSYPDVQPDIDKLERSILDSLTGVVYVDDKQVVSLGATKQWAERGIVSEGVAVAVTFLDWAPADGIDPGLWG